VIGSLNDAVQEFRPFFWIKLVRNLKDNCSEISREFGIVMDIKESIELHGEMRHKLNSKMALGTGNKKSQVKLKQCNCEGAESRLLRHQGMLEYLSDVYFFQCVLE
jgi:hypothetical protein